MKSMKLSTNEQLELLFTRTVADPAMGGQGGPPPIDQKLGLVMGGATQTRGANFHVNP